MSRVLHVINDLHYGGAQTQLRLLVQASRERGDAAAVASLRRPGVEGDALRAGGAPVVWLKSRFSWDPLAVRNLLKLVRGERFEVLQSWDTHSAGLCRAVRRLASVRWVHTLREGPADTVRGADHAVTLSNAFDPGLVTGTPIDKSAARHRLRQAGVAVSDEAPVIVAVARVEQPAAVRELAWMADLARIVCPGLRFLIAGGGPGLMACERFSADATEPGLNTFLGPWDDLRTLYAAADLAWCAAGRGGAPTPALEAMACGLPVMLADSPGREQLLPAEHADPECRLRWDDRALWARVTKRLLNDRPLAEAIGQRNAATVRERHSIDTVAEAHRETVAQAMHADPL